MTFSSNQNKQQNNKSDIPIDYLIKNYWAGDGNAEVTANNETLFQMVQMGKCVDPKICHWAFDNMSGEQLLYMRESTHGSGRAMELYRSDPSSPNSQATVPICRIIRKFYKATLHNRYEVELLDPMTKNHYSSIDCNGHWPKNITFEANLNGGEKLASVKRNTFQKWQLQVSAGEDVLLFIGIACAIGRLSHEALSYSKLI